MASSLACSPVAALDFSNPHWMDAWQATAMLCVFAAVLLYVAIVGIFQMRMGTRQFELAKLVAERERRQAPGRLARAQARSVRAAELAKLRQAWEQRAAAAVEGAEPEPEPTLPPVAAEPVLPAIALPEIDFEWSDYADTFLCLGLSLASAAGALWAAVGTGPHC